MKEIGRERAISNARRKHGSYSVQEMRPRLKVSGKHASIDR